MIAVDAFGFADADVAAALQPMVTRLAALIGHSREDIMAPQGLSVWARAQRTPAAGRGLATPSSRGSTSAIRASPSRSRASLVLGSMIPAAEQRWADADAPGGARAHGASAAARHHPLPADHAVPGAARAASRCRCSIRCATASPASARMADWPAIRRSASRARRSTACRSVCPSSAPRGSDAGLVAVARALEGAT